MAEKCGRQTEAKKKALSGIEPGALHVLTQGLSIAPRWILHIVGLSTYNHWVVRDVRADKSFADSDVNNFRLNPIIETCS